MPGQFSFETVVGALWASLMSRHAKKTRGVPRYAAPEATKPEFREWLRSQSSRGLGDLWECAYSGVPLTFRGDKAESCLSIDHYVPMERGGRTEIANLRVCSRRMNNMKGSWSPKGWETYNALHHQWGPADIKILNGACEGMTYEGRAALVALVRGFDAKDRKYIERQLSAQQTFVKHQRASQKAKAAGRSGPPAVLAGTGRGW